MLHERLARHRLAGEGLTSPVNVVRWFGAVQAQDFPGALWAVGQRLATTTTEREVLAAFDAGTLIRTHVLRPTWHFVAPEDLRWMLALTGPRIQAASAARYRELGLEPSTRTKAERVFTKALAGGRHLTRPALADALSRAGIDPADQRLAHLVMHAELEGLICSGPRVGKQFTYALIDERVPAMQPRDREVAVRTLVTRYFTSHGPATVGDASWWSGLPQRDVREGIALAGEALEALVLDDVTYWRGRETTPVGREHQTPPGRGAAVVHLLPSFDEYTVAYRDRRTLLHAASEVSTLAQSALLSQPLMVNGRHAGMWKRTLPHRDDAPVALDVRVMEPLRPGVRRALHLAADRYAAYLGRSVAINVR
jgi:hypothetical protein